MKFEFNINATPKEIKNGEELKEKKKSNIEMETKHEVKNLDEFEAKTRLKVLR